jgi:hypothetical protein
VGPSVMDFVVAGRTGEPTNWSRRYKLNVERLKSGDRAQIAVVVATLSERQDSKGLSAGEKRMLSRARQMLDDPPDGQAGDREPRHPLPHLISGSIGLTEPAEPQEMEPGERG